jgi:hypothetical protein
MDGTMGTDVEQNNKIGENTGNRGKGRPKGAMNKNSKLLKDAILEAAARAGNKFGKDGLVSYLEEQAEKNPTAFINLMGKVLPLQVKADIEGEVDHVVRVEWQPPH